MSQSPEISDDANSRKRKHHADEGRKKAKRSKSTTNQGFHEEIDQVNNLNLALAKLDPNLMADHIARKQKRFEADATSLELEERRVSANAIVDSTEWIEVRNLDGLPRFLKQFSGTDDLTKTSKEFGSPHTIVVAGAGLRAANITRALRVFESKHGKVAKLFAKHIKLSESSEMLRKTRISIGVGTPARLTALLDDGSLKSNKIRQIIIDASHTDLKKRGILDMQETCTPLLMLLNRNEFKDQLGNATDGIQLLFY